MSHDREQKNASSSSETSEKKQGILVANINTLLYGAEELELASVKNKYEERIRELERENKGDSKGLRGQEEEDPEEDPEEALRDTTSTESTDSTTEEESTQSEPDMPTMPDDAEPRSNFMSLLIICYNRPQYLRNLFDNIHNNLPDGYPLDIFISQDGNNPKVEQEIQAFQKQMLRERSNSDVKHLQHKREQRSNDDSHGYKKLSRHFGWALGKVFENDYEHVIVLEEDLEIAVDFFQYFFAMAELLDNDETILAVSAYNDIGQPQFVSDPKLLLRSDFFPGLGWMISRRTWDEIGPRWPEGFWDDWMREPHVRKGRAIIRPEVSRTKTIGKVGVSGSQYFNKFLSNIQLNSDPINWAYEDIDYLLKDTFDRDFHALVTSADIVDLDSLHKRECHNHHPEEQKLLKTFYKLYASDSGSFPTWEQVARKFGFIDDIKAGVPRTAYQGIVRISHKGCTKLFSPHGWTPENYRIAGG